MKHANIHILEAIALQEQGMLTEARNQTLRALPLEPDNIENLLHLASIYSRIGDHLMSIAVYQRIISLLPDDLKVKMLLGAEYAETGNHEQAIGCFNECLEVAPDNPFLHMMAGIALNETGRHNAARHHFETACQIDPGNDTALTHLANTLIHQLNMSEAERYLLKALDINPENALAYNNLARVYKFQGRSAEATSVFRKALKLEPDNPVVINNLLQSLLYLPDASSESVFSEHQMLCNRAYNAKHPLTDDAPRAPRKDVRIGYVSGDFHHHSVTFFFEPVLLHHDRQRFSIFCYSNDSLEDDATLRLKATKTEWRSIVGRSDEQAAEMIRSDGIDILVDLSGHSSGNRLGLFALKPAPVQISWLGYPHSTGLQQMDYYLSDGFCDPPGMTDHLYTETLIRLSRSFCCYLPPLRFPAVSPPPAAGSGVVTFGSFNHFAKVNGTLIGLWAAILKLVPDSRLLLKSMALGGQDTQQRILATFKSLGIASGRIALLRSVSSPLDHLELYAQIDIALDTYPYHGTTTTCEALWMGVPVVTMAGKTHASRVGVSLLTNIGCPELIASDSRDYINIAVALAGDLGRLGKYRQNLRSMMADSPLMDYAGSTNELESTYSTLVLPLMLKPALPDIVSAGTLPYPEAMELADTLYAEKQYKECEDIYQTYLLRFPQNADLYNRRGMVFDAQGRFCEAIDNFNKALALRSDFDAARFNLANALRQIGDLGGCQEQLHIIAAANPDFPGIWHILAANYLACDKLEAAATCLEELLRTEPDNVAANSSLGSIYQRMSIKTDAALTCFNTVLTHLPDFIPALNSKGTLLHEMDELDGAEACFRRALDMEPNNAKIMNNLGLTLLARVQPQAAIEQFNRALELEPDAGPIRFNRGMAKLITGDFVGGWPDYEARFSTQSPVEITPLHNPRWNGEPLQGKTLLVLSEQGYGDNIQFARYLPLLTSYGGTVVFECMDQKIKPLFFDVPGVDLLVARGEQLPPADFQIPLASLPLLLNTDLSSIPFPGGYLAPGKNEYDLWKTLIDRQTEGHELKVGIVWEGRKTRLNANRSLSFQCIIPLLNAGGIRWFSLQTGVETSMQPEQNGAIIDLGQRITDFSDTAAIIANLDLVITVDTAVAHLSGALGTPTWLMLKHSPDWRWLLERDGSPWYESVRLFRQKATGDWGSVVEEIRIALNYFVA